jgi:hypothetical protein
MKRLLRWIDEVAATTDENQFARVLERVAFVFLVIMVVASPHSIAATQTAWLIGMLASIIRLFIKPRPQLRFGALGIAFAAFFVWSAISAAFSYEPAVSLDKLRGGAVLLIFFFVHQTIRNQRAVYFLSFALIASCMVNVIWTPVQKLLGRGVEVHGLVDRGPLARTGIVEGDTLLKANGQKLNSPEQLVAEIDQLGSARVDVYRTDAPFSVELKSEIGAGATMTAAERLGFTSWNRSSNFRAAGFYGHYTTYAEVLQLIGALAFGLFISGISRNDNRRILIVLAGCLAGIAFALLLTVTRASQLGFMVSSMAIVLTGASRKTAFVAVAIAIPAALIGLFVLQQQRGVGFLDTKDGSIQYRQMMMRDGVRLWTESPRHFLVGVGTDTVKTHWREWRLFDNGFQPMGHFHSTPLQLVVERGLPALLIWLIVLGIYVRSLGRGLRSSAVVDWRSRGILLGCLGGAIGFFTSSLVHFNLGDQEVAMVFYILMGFGMKLAEIAPGNKLA